jgi:hypothetical protein
MTTVAWKADEQEVLREGARLDEAAARLRSAAPGEVEACSLSLLEAAGRLALMGVGHAVTAWARGRADGGRPVAEALAGSQAFAGIEDAAVAVVAVLDRQRSGAGGEPRPVHDGGSAGSADSAGSAPKPPEHPWARARDALELRGQIEIQIAGATAILGHPPDLGPDQHAALLVFEDLVRPEVWRLTALNEGRRQAVAWMSPAHRPGFWWWHEGADVSPEALSSLPAVAHLVSRFPAAADALRSLVRAQETWDGVGGDLRARRSASAERAAVVSLGAWLERRAGEARGGAYPGLALAAAAAGEEITLVDRADFQVSWSPPDALVIDLVADRAPGTRPLLRLAGGVIVLSEPVAGAEERFRISAGAPVLGALRAVLVLPLANGTLEIPFPPGS